MQKRQVLINAIMSVAQIIVVGVVLFVLYRFLLKTIGVEKFGIWTLVVSIASITEIANLGLSGSIVKFVAKYIAREEHENVSGIIQTTSLFIGIFIGLVLLIGYPFVKWVLGLVIPSESLHLAIDILPLSLFALWFMMITSIFQASLDGCQRIDLRSFLLMGGVVFHLVLCFFLAPAYGLMGLAYAKAIQNFTLLIVSWLLLKKQLPILPFIPYKWNKNLFKEIIGYGVNFQIITFAVMSCDPVTKAFMGKFGGLSMVGYYEMANKMVVQFRALIVNANQVIVPAIANLQEKIPEKIQTVYQTSYKLLFYLSLPLFTIIVVSVPLISELWIGHYERVFVVFGTLLAVGWFLNSLNAPAYFAYLGIGELRWNVIGHIVIAALNIVLGYSLGTLYDGMGVITAWIIALTVGSSMIYISYHIKYKIPLSELMPKESRIATTVCLISLVSIILIKQYIDYVSNTVFSNVIIVLIYSAIIFFPLWLHPMREKLVGWVTNELLNRNTRIMNG